MKFQKQNLRNIKSLFEEKTGVALNPVHRQRLYSKRKMWIMAAAAVCCLVMAAFTYPLFSSLDGDELSLHGTYEGSGIVSIQVENRSDKKLKFQKQTKLMRWVTAEEIPRLDGEVVFENTTFEPHSKGTMIIDLSGAYDMQALEESDTNAEWFYLVLTNNNFLFGQDWMCSVNFAAGQTEAEPKTIVEETVPSVSVEPLIAEEIEAELRFYFEESYGGELLAFNEANFQYQQKVEEVLARFEGTVIPSMSPMIMVAGTSQFLDPEPRMGKPPADVIFDASIPQEQQYLLTWADWEYTDAYGRMVATSDEKAWAQVAVLPQRKGETDGGVTLPLIFLFVYDVDMAKSENYAFIYGQLHSFGELEEFKVLEDAHYAVYDATDLIYTDVDAYLDYFLSTREDVYCDDSIRRRVHNIYDFYQDKENVKAIYGYLDFSSQ